METTAFSAITIKALNEEKREIEGMASTPTVDRDKDVINPFGLTFEAETPLLLQHDHKQPVGTVRFGQPTAKGLPFKATIAKVDEAGVVKSRLDEAWHSVKSGIIKSVSIGFRAKDAEALPDGGRFFKKAAIHELSLTPIPANPEAVITAFKQIDATKPDVTAKPTMENFPSMTTKQTPQVPSTKDQIYKAISKGLESNYAEFKKDAIAPASTANVPALYYQAQVAGIKPLPTTAPIIESLLGFGAPALPTNIRFLLQKDMLQASEIGESDLIPAAAPSLDFGLTSHRKFGLIVAFSNTLLAPLNLSGQVLGYVESQLDAAANNATDDFMVSLMTGLGVAATSVAGAMAAFDGDLRSAVWIGNPKTLATLQDATNPNVGPRGGVYQTLPAIASLAVPVGKLILQDATRITVYDGPKEILRSEEATITVDTADGPATVYLYQENLTALRITKYADAKILTAPQIITL